MRAKSAAIAKEWERRGVRDGGRSDVRPHEAPRRGGGLGDGGIKAGRYVVVAFRKHGDLFGRSEDVVKRLNKSVNNLQMKAWTGGVDELDENMRRECVSIVEAM